MGYLNTERIVLVVYGAVVNVDVITVMVKVKTVCVKGREIDDSVCSLLSTERFNAAVSNDKVSNSIESRCPIWAILLTHTTHTHTHGNKPPQ